MGDLIPLSERAERHLRTEAWQRAEFYFDLACPFTYLAADRLESAFDAVRWTPARAPGLLGPSTVALRRAAEERAAALRLPLVWPERWTCGAPAAMRVATYAAWAGRGAEFVLAATRLAFCGGFHLDDPEILAEACAAAGLPLEECFRAARDRRRQEAVEAAGRTLLAAGADRLPALRTWRALFWGEARVSEAVAGARLARAVAR
jgi:2-hydroxychromene-2-carboxylate isomerase